MSENTSEVTTVSDLFKTAHSVLKTGAIKALKKDKLLLMAVDAFNINKVGELNVCAVSNLESGLAFLVEVTEQPANIFLESKGYKEISPSLWSMLEIHEKSENIENPIVEIEV